MLHDIMKDTVAGVGVVASAKELSTIHHPGCAATLWKRDLLSGLLPWIDTLPPEQLPRTRMLLRPHAIRRALPEIFEASGMPDCAERAMLAEDISALAGMFAEVMAAPYLRLRLDVITTNACRKFHVDAVTARLVCTYRGTGTQYGFVTEDGRGPDQVFTVETGAPILLRGTLWPETPRSGLRHRSPPIEGTGETRLVLVLDPVSGLDEEANRSFDQ